MKSKVSYFNLGIQKQNLKQHGWIGLVFLIGWLFVLPLRMIELAESERQFLEINNMFDITETPQMLLTVGIPIITGIFLFRYLQVSIAADMMHSLPIKRGSLLVNQVITGAFMLLIPIWLTGVAISLVASAYPLYNDLTASNIWNWIVIMSVMSLFFFIFTVFVSMLTGNSVISGILTFIVLVLPVGLISLISANLSMLLYGYTTANGTDNYIDWSPIVLLTRTHNNDIDLWQIGIYLLLAILSGVIAYVLYQFRHVEMATQAITFKPLRPVFKYGVTVCAMLVGGIYFGENSSTHWTIFGYLCGSLIGYLVAEMILQKTWRVFRIKPLLGYVGYGIVMILIGIGIIFDVFGFETNVPSADAVDSVYFGHNVHKLNDTEIDNQSLFSSNENYIENVRTFHKEIVSKQPEESSSSYAQSTNSFNNTYVVGYRLENGSMMVREYRNISLNGMEEKSMAVMETDDYKYQEYNLGEIDKSISEFHFFPDDYSSNEPLTISNAKEVNEIREILKYEISSMDVNDVMNSGNRWGTIGFYKEDNTKQMIDIPWHKSFEELDIWLENNDYLDQVRMSVEDVQSMEILRIPGGSVDIYKMPGQVFSERSEQNDSIRELEDEAVIEEVIQNYSPNGTGEYYVHIRHAGDSNTYGVLSGDQVPEEVESLFN
ncbi:hypothetical protein D7Z54_14905 [Salibacterium salarium]|uniref:ABC-2 type transport system permease protein n=1 Tax=Salibacterium salarium TaxID=284579 RepID=A0A3R9QKL6_9BACI|nr:hypothetical protein [Salibacterium salarium]RSL32444.1 hypothetical protein D7Z54_14905 [Salibacterium salarium]